MRTTLISAAIINTPQEETVAAIQHKGKQFRGKNTRKKQPPPLPPRPAGGHGGQNNQQQQNDNAPLISSQAGYRPVLLPLVIWREGKKLPGTLLLARKLAGWGVIGAIHPGKLIHVVNTNNGSSFLVDTSSSYSIIPHSSNFPPSGPLLKVANGQ